LDGTGLEYTVRIDSVDNGLAWAIEERRRNEAETSRTVVLYQGLLKASKLETVLQKCTEIGVSRFVPMATARSIPTEPGAERLRRFEAIAREAAEQSGRGIVPAVERPMAFEAALLRACSEGPVVLLHEGESAVSLDGLEMPGAAPVGLFVGPEGGFDASEIEAARAASATVAGLGPRILRSETAAIVGSALLISRLEAAAGSGI
jgi:16S rRNA (uracil1498-N3)-methyltransferase